MNSLLIVLVACAGIIMAAPFEAPKMRFEHRFLEAILGDVFGPIWDVVSEVGSAALDSLTAIGVQLLFAGTAMWEQAQIVFAQLAADLTNHTADALTLVTQAITNLTGVLATGARRSARQQKFLDVVVEFLGLGPILDVAVEIGSAAIDSLVEVGMALLMSGTAMWEQAQGVFGQLLADLTNHTADALTLVTQAITNLTGVLATGTRQHANNAKFFEIVFDFLGLGSFVDTIAEVGSAALESLAAVGTQLLFAGSAIWAQAEIVLAQLAADLTNHTADALTLVTQAITNLTGVLATGARSTEQTKIIDFLLDLFGLHGLVETFNHLSSQVVAQFSAILASLLTSSQGIWEIAQGVFSQLMADLTNHTADALTLVTQAITNLTGVLATGTF